MNQAAYDCGPLLSLMQDKLHCHVERLSAGRFQLQEAERTVRAQFGDVFAFEGNRALIIPATGPLPLAPLAFCLRAALTYHRAK